MANTIQHKRSSTSGAAPAASGLSQGELAINIADGKFYTKNNANSVINLGVTSISGTYITPASGNFNYLAVSGVPVSVSGHNHSSIEVNTLSQEPQGFVNRDDSTISFNDSTRTFTIQPATSGSSYTLYIEGIKVVKNTVETVVLGSGTALNYIHFDTTPPYILQTKTSAFDFDTDVPVAFIHWNGGINQSTFFGEERHGIKMDSMTHKWIHNTFGMQYINGLSIGGYTLLGNGSSNSHAQFDISDGTLYQEDIIINITNGVGAGSFIQQLSPIAYIPVYYHSGTTGQWVRDTATSFPLKYNATRAQYNLYSGGTWTTPNVGDKKYFAMWIVATNDINEPILAILGQREDDNLNSATSNNNWSDIDLTNIPTSEIRPLYRLIFITDNTFTNTPKSSLQSILDIRVAIQSTSIGVVQNDHGILFGLADDDHSQYVHINNARTIDAIHTFTNGLLSSGNVGIGTSTPTVQLEVIGDIYGNNILSTGYLISNALLSVNDFDGGSPGTIYIGELTSLNHPYWTIDQNGSGNFSTLSVNDTIVSLNGHTHSSSDITNFNSSVSGLLPVGTSNYLSKFGTGGSGLSNSLVFDNGTSVGINTNTPSSSARLEVNGAIQQTWSSSRLGMFFDNNYRMGINYNASSRIMQIFSTSNDSNGHIAFSTRIGAGSSDTDYGTERMRITNSGYVGIGTTSPTAPLQVAGLLQGNSVGTTGIIVSNSHASQSANGQNHTSLYVNPTFLTSSSNLNSTYGLLISPSSSGQYTTTNSYGLYVNASTLVTGTILGNYAAVFMGGNVGIGTASPTATLHVVGTGLFTSIDINNSAIAGSAALTVNGNIITQNNIIRGGTFSIYGDNNTRIYKADGSTLNYSVSSSGYKHSLGYDVTGNHTSWMVVNNTGVGIGTQTPTSKLHVAGDVLATGSFIGGSGTASLPSFEFINDTDTGLFSPAANTFGVSTSGVERLRINNLGNIGIGITAPTAKLDVRGSFSCGTVVGDPSAGAAGLFVDPSVPSLAFNDNIGPNIALTIDDNGLTLFDSAASPFFYTDRANARIGIGTNSPAAKLDVNGVFKSLGFKSYGSISWFGNSAGTVGIAANTNPSGTFGSNTEFACFQGFNDAITSYNPICFTTQNGAQVYLNTDGRVGIGTASPAAKLDVNGTAFFGSNLLGRIEFGEDTFGGELGFYDNNGNTLALRYADGSFQYGGGSPGAANLVVTSSGNVGIGGIDPDTKLQVYGDFVCSPAGGGFSAKNGEQGVYINSDGTLVIIDNGPSAVAYLNANGLSLYADIGAGGGTIFSTDRSNSRIGIGTSTPSTTLDVLGDVNIDGNLTFDSFTESVVANGSSGTSKTLSLASGTVHTCTLTGNCTFTMPTATAGKSFTLFLNSGAGNYTATFTGVRWADSATPTATITASKVDIYSFISDGTYWYGSFSQNYG